MRRLFLLLALPPGAIASAAAASNQWDIRLLHEPVAYLNNIADHYLNSTLQNPANWQQSALEDLFDHAMQETAHERATHDGQTHQHRRYHLRQNPVFTIAGYRPSRNLRLDTTYPADSGNISAFTITIHALPDAEFPHAIPQDDFELIDTDSLRKRFTACTTTGECTPPAAGTSPCHAGERHNAYQLHHADTHQPLHLDICGKKAGDFPQAAVQYRDGNDPDENLFYAATIHISGTYPLTPIKDAP